MPARRINRRLIPDDFEIIFVEQGRLECEAWYRARRTTITRWLVQSGRRRLLEKRKAFVRYSKARAKGQISRAMTAGSGGGWHVAPA